MQGSVWPQGVSAQAYSQRVLRPPEGASARIHQPPLPALDAARVHAVIHDVAARNAGNPKCVLLCINHEIDIFYLIYYVFICFSKLLLLKY